MTAKTPRITLSRISKTSLCFALAAVALSSAAALAAREKAPTKRQGGNPLAKLDAKNQCPPAVKAEHGRYIDVLQNICSEGNASLKKQLEAQYKQNFPHCVSTDSMVLGVAQQSGGEVELTRIGKAFEIATKKVGINIYKPVTGISRFIDEGFSDHFGSLGASIADICLRLKLAATEIGATCRAFTVPKAGEKATEPDCIKYNEAPKGASGQSTEFRGAASLTCRGSVQSRNLADGLNRARWQLKDPKEDAEQGDAARKGAPPKIDQFVKVAVDHYRGFDQHFMKAREKVRQARQQYGNRMDKQVLQIFDNRFPICDKLGAWVATSLYNDYVNKLIHPLKRVDEVFYTAEREASNDADRMALQSAVNDSRLGLMSDNMSLTNMAESNLVKSLEDQKEIEKKFGKGFKPVTGMKAAQYSIPNYDCQAVARGKEVKWVCVKRAE